MTQEKLTREGFEQRYNQEIEGKKLSLVKKYMVAMRVMCEFEPELHNPEWFDDVVAGDIR